MSNIRPFCAVRPKSGMEGQIAALPYDVYNRKEAKDYVMNHPNSFLKIDRAESQFPDDVDTYDTRVYDMARKLYEDMLKEGKFVKDSKACYFLYEQIMDGRAQTGLVATASVMDYMNNVIKKHENTRADKELDRINHVDRMNAQTGPIFLAYRNNKDLEALFARIKSGAPLYSFETEQNIKNTVWVVDNDSDIEFITSTFEKIPNLYIADGHHRCASAAKVSMMRREMAEKLDENAEYNYFLSVIFPDSELMIMDYNRVVKDLNGFTEAEFVEKLSHESQLHFHTNKV